MSKGWYVICANCGRQCEIDGPEDTCIFCGKNASKKEVIMAKTPAVAEEKVVASIPAKPRKRKKLWEYYEQNKEAMITDYQSMRVTSFFSKWGLGSLTWQKLKEKWGVPNKGKHSMYKRTKAPRKQYKEPRPEPGEFCILITEIDLARLDDEQFRQLWLVLGRIVQNRKT